MCEGVICATSGVIPSDMSVSAVPVSQNPSDVFRRMSHKMLRGGARAEAAERMFSFCVRGEDAESGADDRGRADTCCSSVRAIAEAALRCVLSLVLSVCSECVCAASAECVRSGECPCSVFLRVELSAVAARFCLSGVSAGVRVCADGLLAVLGLCDARDEERKAEEVS